MTSVILFILFSFLIALPFFVLIWILLIICKLVEVPEELKNWLQEVKLQLHARWLALRSLGNIIRQTQSSYREKYFRSYLRGDPFYLLGIFDPSILYRYEKSRSYPPSHIIYKPAIITNMQVRSYIFRYQYPLLSRLLEFFILKIKTSILKPALILPIIIQFEKELINATKELINVVDSIIYASNIGIQELSKTTIDMSIESSLIFRKTSENLATSLKSFKEIVFKYKTKQKHSMGELSSSESTFYTASSSYINVISYP